MRIKRRDLPASPDVGPHDIDAIREKARCRAFALLSKGSQRGENRCGWVIDVTDDTGAVVFSMSLADATRV